MRPIFVAALIAAGSLSGLSGCATKEFVLEETGRVDRRLTALEQALNEARAKAQDRMNKGDARLDAHDTQLTAQDKRLTALGNQQAQTDKVVAVNAQFLRDAEKNLQLVRVDLSATQSRLDNQGKQVASLQSGLETERKSTQQAIHAQGQRIAGTEQGLQKVGQELVDARTQSQVKAQALTQQIGQTQAHLEQQGKQVDTLSVGLDTSKQAMIEHAQRLRHTEDQAKAAASERANIMTTANDALSRANAAGKLAQGKLMYASVLSHEMSGFKLDHADLGDDAKAAIKAFAETLKTENANVYLEIQGHTDTSGKAETNRFLSQRRAEAVRDFLYAECGIALHRMAVFAYGGSRPIADNKKREGRVQNRRVVIVVLK